MAELPSADKRPLLVVAFDVETTGDRLPVCLRPPAAASAAALDADAAGWGDALISVGWAGGRLTAAEPLAKPEVELLVEPRRLDIDLGKPSGVTWEEYWKTRGWSETTFRRFWSGRLSVLDGMQQTTTSLRVASHLLNRELAQLEEKYELVPIVDAVGFDASWVDVLLNSQGHRGLGQTRTGRSRRVIDAYSFRLGRALLDHKDAAPGHENGSEAARTAFARQREVFAEMYEHPHYSDQDAKGILVAYLSSLAAPQS